MKGSNHEKRHYERITELYLSVWYMYICTYYHNSLIYVYSTYVTFVIVFMHSFDDKRTKKLAFVFSWDWSVLECNLVNNSVAGGSKERNGKTSQENLIFKSRIGILFLSSHFCKWDHDNVHFKLQGYLSIIRNT